MKPIHICNSIIKYADIIKKIYYKKQPIEPIKTYRWVVAEAETSNKTQSKDQQIKELKKMIDQQIKELKKIPSVPCLLFGLIWRG